MKTAQVCHFCNQEIKPAEFSEGKAILMRNPKNEQIAAHTRHNGVEGEYDNQLNIKSK